jgi:disease resistance protein RPM1
MQSEADVGALDHFLREWMKQLREVGYDAEDCVNFYLFRVRSRQGDRCFVRWKRLLGTLWARRRLAGDIRDLRALASAINEQHARYGFSLEPLRRRDAASSLGPAAASARPPLGPADSLYSHRHQFVGNKALAVDLANKIKALDPYLADSSLARQQSQPQAIKIEHLGTLPRPGSSWQAGTEQALNDEDDKQLPKVFSILGFGGLGKTTLALEVCRLLEAEFPCQAQVSVSQTFSGKDLQGLLKRLLRQIVQPKHTEHTAAVDPLANIDTMDARQLENKLKENLENNRYVTTPVSHTVPYPTLFYHRNDNGKIFSSAFRPS